MALEAFTILSGLAGVAGFAGNIMKGDADREAAEYNAAIDAESARETEAQYAENERVFRANTRMQLAESRVGFAASGLSAAEGSAAEVLRMSAANAELDALKLKHEGFLKARSFRESAILQRKTGRIAQTSGYLSAVGSLLGAGGSILGRLDPGGTGSNGKKL